jgi:catechol 2,3-dioxygenase-like lactoylglutathione lyase family enzyme
MLLHHVAITVRDFDEALRFWRDGLGLELMMDNRFDGDWRTLFNADASRLHSCFLGDPQRPDAGVVELVEFVDRPLEDHPLPAVPTNGLFLLSFNVDVDATLGRLAALGLGGQPREIAVHGVRMCTVVAPDGVLVELIGLTEMPVM